MTKNGEMDLRALDDALKRLEAYEQAEVARVQEEIIATRVQLALTERQAAPRRSQMSALEKSRFIRAHGLPAYQRLDW